MCPPGESSPGGFFIDGDSTKTEQKKSRILIGLYSQKLAAAYFLRFFLGLTLAFLTRASFSACSRSCAAIIGAISSLTFLR